MKPSLIVHGGAGNFPEEKVPDCRAGIERALRAGWQVLSSGGSAIDAIESSIVVLEDDPVFDAGVGSYLNLDGRVQLDAIVMGGQTLKSGAVAAVERIRNPIRLARKVLEETQHMMFVGAGAEQFAVEHGLSLCPPDELITESERMAWQRCRQSKHDPRNHAIHQSGTVGAVAMDSEGHLFAGTSTGGTCCKLPGRVGDSPLIGCGCYADSEAGGVSCTGFGEGIMKIVMAKTAVDLLRGDAAPENRHTVTNRCLDLLASRARATGGLILLDRNGNPSSAFNTRGMSYGYVEPDSSFRIFV